MKIKKNTPQEVKDVVKKNRYQNQHNHQSTNNDENDMQTQKKEDLVNYLKKKKAPTSGNEDDFLKRCMLWKC